MTATTNPRKTMKKMMNIMKKMMRTMKTTATTNPRKTMKKIMNIMKKIMRKTVTISTMKIQKKTTIPVQDNLQIHKMIRMMNQKVIPLINQNFLLVYCVLDLDAHTHRSQKEI
jgi:predicted metal-dependent hydrolase